MKAIILAGGSGSRLYPTTQAICKQLLPVYDKPMIYYPLTTLMLAGLRDILIITNPHEQPLFEKLFADGLDWGIKIQYATQPRPDGLPQAFLIGEEFIGDQSVCLILGDNIIYGNNLGRTLQTTMETNDGATVFVYYVRDPERYGVISFDNAGKPLEIVEKPKQPKSNFAVIGLYIYDNHVIEIAKTLKPSARGELEITDINQHYLRENKLRVEKFSRGVAWLDTGTAESLIEAANFIHVLDHRQLLKFGCPEEVAWRMGYIDNEQFKRLAMKQAKNDYGKYLLNLYEHEAETVVAYLKNAL